MELGKYNPIVILVYFASNILITMITKNPVYIGISFFSVVIYSLVVKLPNKLFRKIIFIIIILIFASLTNPIFNNLGKIILFKIGKFEFSVEAIFYGFIASLMLVTIVLWFRNYNLLMTSDKFLYIFSKYFPNISLIISMILKLIPELLKKLRDLNDSEKLLGTYYEMGFIKRLKNKFLLLGNLFSYTIENSLITAISMKARGYGLRGKTKYKIYKFRFKDLKILLYIIISTLFILYFGSDSLLNYSFYPIDKIDTSILSLLAYLVFIILANLATLLHLKEKIKWHYLNSKIYPSHTH